MFPALCHAIAAACAVAGPPLRCNPAPRASLRRRGHKVVVFVLDDFDMFAAKAKQTVLYYLLDSMQAPETQVRPGPPLCSLPRPRLVLFEI